MSETAIFKNIVFNFHQQIINKFDFDYATERKFFEQKFIKFFHYLDLTIKKLNFANVIYWTQFDTEKYRTVERKKSM